MTTLVRVASAAITTAGAAGAAVATHDLPLLHIPIVPAGGSAALLVTLGYILGRATATPTTVPTRPPTQVTATINRPQGNRRPLPAGSPSALVILPVRNRDGRDAA